MASEPADATGANHVVDVRDRFRGRRGVGIHEAITYGVATPSGSIVPNAVLLLQFVFGLMIVSCMAPASLAEERVRGSLDVLMTTPLSTESILCGKWLGTFRVVLWLAVLPGLTTVILAYSWLRGSSLWAAYRRTAGTAERGRSRGSALSDRRPDALLRRGHYQRRARPGDVGPAPRPRDRHQPGHLRSDHDWLACVL